MKNVGHDFMMGKKNVGTESPSVESRCCGIKGSESKFINNGFS